MLVASVDCVWLNRVQCCCVTLFSQYENVVWGVAYTGLSNFIPVGVNDRCFNWLH